MVMLIYSSSSFLMSLSCIKYQCWFLDISKLIEYKEMTSLVFHFQSRHHLWKVPLCMARMAVHTLSLTQPGTEATLPVLCPKCQRTVPNHQVLLVSNINPGIKIVPYLILLIRKPWLQIGIFCPLRYSNPLVLLTDFCP